MRNIENAIKKIAEHKGLLSASVILYSAKQTLNQYNRGWLKFKNSDAAEAVTELGLRIYLEEPLIDRKLDQELTKRGLDWLKTILFKKNGQPRSTKHTLHADRVNACEIVSKFSHFTFDGFESDGNGNLDPKWRVHSKNGQSFSYVCTLGAHNYYGYIEWYR